MRLEVADLSLATVDALDVDTLLLLVGSERPLQGLAGLVDWRLCGALTRALRGGLWDAGGEALLLPGGGRVPALRVLALGVAGEPAVAALERGLAAAVKAGSAACAVAPPAGMPPEAVARAVADAAARGPARQVVLGDVRALVPALERACAGGAAEVVPFAGRAPVVR